MAITLKSIEQKLGFDPFDPPPIDHDGWTVDDHTQSIWAPLTEAEHVFVLEKVFGIKWLKGISNE